MQSDKILVQTNDNNVFLPNELWESILANLDFTGLCKAQYMSKQLYQLVHAKYVIALPDELWMQIFSHVGFQALLKMQQVSKRWKRLARSNFVWGQYFKQKTVGPIAQQYYWQARREYTLANQAGVSNESSFFAVAGNLQKGEVPDCTLWRINKELALIFVGDRRLNWVKKPLQYLTSSLRNDAEVVLKAVQRPELWYKRRGYTLQDASAVLRDDSHIVMAAVRQNPAALEYASERLRGDIDIVMAAVSTYGYALRYARNAFGNNPQVVLAAMRQDIYALQWASAELKNNPEFMMEAVRTDWRALEYAGYELKYDVEIVKAAVSQNGRALDHAACGFISEQDLQMLEELSKRSVDNGESICKTSLLEDNIGVVLVGISMFSLCVMTGLATYFSKELDDSMDMGCTL